MLVALAGRPLSITFRREETAACSERVVFPSLGRSAHLPPFQDVTLDLLPLEPGEHEFTCQLGVLRGRLVATVDGRPPPRRAWRDPGGVEGAPAAALRRLASGRAETVVLGLVAWLCSLPLLLLLVVPIVGWRVAGTVSVAWLATLLLVCFAICLTRLPRKGRPPPGTPPSGANP